MESRLVASEEYRAQAEARNRLEDTWKAGQEAAMFRWRAEQHAMQQVVLMPPRAVPWTKVACFWA
jgi:hypothetical protein